MLRNITSKQEGFGSTIMLSDLASCSGVNWSGKDY